MVCSRGESLTHHTNQMKLFNAIAAAAVIGTSILSVTPAQANACYPNTAASKMETMMAAGLSPREAFSYVHSGGHLNSRECVLLMKGTVMQYPYSYPRAYRHLSNM